MSRWCGCKTWIWGIIVLVGVSVAAGVPAFIYFGPTITAPVLSAGIAIGALCVRKLGVSAPAAYTQIPPTTDTDVCGASSTADYSAFLPPRVVAGITKLTPEDEMLVKLSWRRILGEETKAFAAQKRIDPEVTGARMFSGHLYAKLFEISPETQVLFKNDMSNQGRVLVVMISAVLAILDTHDPAAIQTSLVRLAKRHVKYGILHHHFAYLLDAFDSALQFCLGEELDRKTASAWLHLHSLLMHYIIPVIAANEIQKYGNPSETSSLNVS